MAWIFAKPVKEEAKLNTWLNTRRIKMYKIKNWNDFQHFKDRSPIWIKVYRGLLNDIEWANLEPIDAKILVELWLLGSETDGYLPDIKTISFRLRKDIKIIEKSLSHLNHWIIEDDNKMISERYQVDALEKRREENIVKRREEKIKPKIIFSEDLVLPDIWNTELSKKFPSLDIPTEFDLWKAYHLEKGSAVKAPRMSFGATWLNMAIKFSKEKPDRSDEVNKILEAI